jgi:glycosyltransferase involved in cell wall biosynthesis
MSPLGEGSERAHDTPLFPLPMEMAAPVMSPPSLFISVIIPTFGRPAPLRRCIASLVSQAYPRELFEVIVVDDGGDPPVARSLPDELTRRIDFRRLEEPHRGAGAARARGIADARGSILALLDDDCSVPPEYLATIERVFRDHPETQVVQVGLENPEPGNIYGLAWSFAFEEALKVNLHPAPHGRFFCGTLGGVAVARREIFTQVAFDPALTQGLGDADLRYQLQARNIPVYYEPQIRVLHHQRQTLRSYLAQFFGYGRGEFHLRRKWSTSPSPFRHVTLTSWPVFRALLRREGIFRGLAISCVLRLRRHAALHGLIYETTLLKTPDHGLAFWSRFGWLLFTAYVRRITWTCRGVPKRSPTGLPL